MAEIKLEKYANDGDYKKGAMLHPATKHSFTINDLKRYAISVGGFSHGGLGSKGQMFYEALVDMALDDTKGKFKQSHDYCNSEKTIKGSISFFMGMIAAKAIGEKEYGIPYLFHLNDPQIDYVTSGKTPDFFGLQNGRIPFLIESKGTFSEKPDSKKIKDAKEQIEGIRRIEIMGWPIMYPKKAIKGHVIASGFKKGTLTYYDIDPQPDGKITLKVDVNREIVLYYRAIMHWLINNSKQNIIKVYGENYITARQGQHEIGLKEDVFELLRENFLEFYQNPKRNYDKNMLVPDNIYQILTESVSDIYRQVDQEISIGTDGILYR